MSLQTALSALGGVTAPVATQTPAAIPAEQSKATQMPINTTAEPVKEEVKPVEVAKPKPEEKDSAKFAALARKERAIQAEKAHIATERARIEAKEKEFTDREARIKQFEAAKAGKDYNKAAEALGITYDEWTNYLLNENKPTPELEVKGLKQEFDEYKKDQQEKAKLAEEKTKKEAQDKYNEAITEFKEEVNTFLLTNKDEYELINLTKTNEVVLAVIEQHYYNTAKNDKPVVLSIKEASDLVEADLEDKARKAAATKKLSKAKGDAGKDTQEKPDAKQVKGETENPTSDRPKSTPRYSTLNNNMTGTSIPEPKGPMSDEDRIKKAMAKLT